MIDTDIQATTRGSRPRDFIDAGDKVFFSARDDDVGRIFRVLDLSASVVDTDAIKTVDLNPDPNSSDVGDIFFVRQMAVGSAQIANATLAIGVFGVSTTNIAADAITWIAPPNPSASFPAQPLGAIGDKAVFRENGASASVVVLDLGAATLDESATTTIAPRRAAME